MNLPHIVLINLAVINVVTFFMYGIDKWKAKKSKWRIRETALLGLAVLGGSIGAWLGMKVWHHKTQHKGGNRDIDNIMGGYQFKYGVPVIIIDSTIAYVGSANLTGAGMGMKSPRKRNFEAGILTDDPEMVDAAIEQFDNVWMGKFCKDCGRREYCTDPIK